ncbi:hypothetical protein [Spiroplasma endosymbiont of Dactylopius coccus]|nr:hypothetical protein [Spiroplasma ixodetis]
MNWERTANFNEEYNLIIELKNIVKESFPEQYFEIIKFKQEQARINFDYFFPELKIPDNAINFWKQIIQEENLEQFLSVEWKEKIAELCNVFINFEKNIKKFKIIGEDYQEFILNHKRNLEKVKECSDQVVLVSNVMKRKQFLIDLEDYNNENYYNSFQKKLSKSINELKNFINNIEDSKIMNYYYQFLIFNSIEQFAADSLEWNINRICDAINNEFTILKKISDSYTSDLTKNFIMKYIAGAVNLTKSTSEKMKEITLQFDRHCEQLVEEENKLIEVINKKIEALENINKTERTTYENLSRTLENVSLDNDKKMITELKQQIENIRTITKEKITESKKKQEEAIERRRKTKNASIRRN